jgi:hypothetical protein
MRPLSSILMATTSKRSAMSQQKKPKVSSSYTPECVEGEFCELRVLEILRSIAVARRRVQLNGI